MYQDWMEKIPIIEDINIDNNNNLQLIKDLKN